MPMTLELMIFKTTIRADAEVNRLRPYLDGIFWHGNWNIDLADSDKILRIVAPRSAVEDLYALARKLQLSFIELEPDNVIVMSKGQVAHDGP